MIGTHLFAFAETLSGTNYKCATYLLSGFDKKKTVEFTDDDQLAMKLVTDAPFEVFLSNIDLLLLDAFTFRANYARLNKINFPCK